MSRDIFFIVLKLVTKLAMLKSESDKDIAKNKTIMTAIVSLAMEETDGELQES